MRAARTSGWRSPGGANAEEANRTRAQGLPDPFALPGGSGCGVSHRRRALGAYGARKRRLEEGRWQAMLILLGGVPLRSDRPVRRFASAVGQRFNVSRGWGLTAISSHIPTRCGCRRRVGAKVRRAQARAARVPAQRGGDRAVRVGRRSAAHLRQRERPYVPDRTNARPQSRFRAPVRVPERDQTVTSRRWAASAVLCP